MLGSEYDAQNEAAQEARRQQLAQFNLARQAAGETPNPTQSPTDRIRLTDQETGADYTTPIASLPTSGASRFEVSVPLPQASDGLLTGLSEEDVWDADATLAVLFNKSNYEGCTSIRFRVAVNVVSPLGASASMGLRLALAYHKDDPELVVLTGSEILVTSTADESDVMIGVPHDVFLSADFTDELPSGPVFIIAQKMVSEVTGAVWLVDPYDLFVRYSNLAVVISYGE